MGDRRNSGLERSRRRGSIGARFLEHHGVSVMFAHISNANLCDRNERLDALGVRYGYKF